MKVVHVITGLLTGGAETVLWRLLSHMDRGQTQSTVVSMTSDGPIGGRIRELGIPVHILNLRRGIPSPAGLWSLRRLLSAEHPDVVQTWMYQADLMGGIAARLARQGKVIWNIRQSDFDPRDAGAAKRFSIATSARLSRAIPNRIICCSEASYKVHAELGYDHRKMLVIPNGFDTSEYRPNLDARTSVREEIGIEKDTILIGLAGRFDPQKDHKTFVQAAGELAGAWSNVHFVLCGRDGISPDNTVLMEWIIETGFQERFHLLGERSDMSRIHASLDIGVSSSAYGEGFSNVVGETMSSGVACVVTDVGDSARIVGDTGLVTPPRNPSALTSALHQLLSLDGPERRALGLAARERVLQMYSLPSTVRKYEALYLEVAQS